MKKKDLELLARVRVGQVEVEARAGLRVQRSGFRVWGLGFRV